MPPDRIGTLHSHCWRALGGPRIAEAHVDEWNREHPGMRITPTKASEEKTEIIFDDTSDPASTSTDGDLLLQQVNRYRGMLLPRPAWPGTARQFDQHWRAYKDANGLMDFTDLIENARNDCWQAPGAPSVIFADEAQDLNPMQLELIRKWGERTEYFICSGDDDQVIYNWTGACPEGILYPEIPPAHKIILRQSYRIPRAVHEYADKLIRRVSQRQEKDYLPRDEQGALHHLSTGNWRCPEYAVLGELEKCLGRGESVMLLASCSYMLAPAIKLLRKSGLPFGNPYRLSNGAWNPIRVGKRGAATNRILALLAAHPVMGGEMRPWTYADVKLWAEWLTSKGILQQGAKKLLGSKDPATEVHIEDLDSIFTPQAAEALLGTMEGSHQALLDWWLAHTQTSVRSRAAFPALVSRRLGPAGLTERPRIIVGTIHSVKGGEADAVFLFPDLSEAGHAAYLRRGAPHDAVIRLFYVGATRARRSLYWCAPASARALNV